jgi:hypothetical protein
VAGTRGRGGLPGQPDRRAGGLLLGLAADRLLLSGGRGGVGDTGVLLGSVMPRSMPHLLPLTVEWALGLGPMTTATRRIH